MWKRLRVRCDANVAGGHPLSFADLPPVRSKCWLNVWIAINAALSCPLHNMGYSCRRFVFNYFRVHDVGPRRGLVLYEINAETRIN
jgi:hypothetical protein